MSIDHPVQIINTNKPEQAIVFPLELKIIQVNSLYLQTIKKIISNHFGLKYMMN